MAKNKKNDLLDNVVSLAKRRGFVFQSSDVYGGLNGCWDFGPNGVELLRNVKDEWWKFYTYREDVEGLDASILMHPRVWEASGHVENFTDPMVDCKQCRARFRLDHLAERMKAKKKIKGLEAAAGASGVAALKDAAEKARDAEESELNALFEAALENQETSSALLAALNCPECGTQGSFTEARKFNLMFKTFVGPVESDKNAVFLRPETAQGIFVNFPNVSSVTRHKLPFGVAQVGKSFRNEINTKYFLFRTREFEQMEMQYFVRPEEDAKWYEYWKEARMKWYLELGISKEKLRFHDHPEDKLAHYAKQAADVEYLFPFGWGEIEGIHNRTNFDISRHQEFSGKSFQYVDAESKEKFLPYIIETAAGATRAFMAFLVDGYYEEEVKGETRTALRLHPRLAPYKAAIFPLVNKEGMPDKARALEADLRKHFKVFFDDKGAVGRRYRRMDEIGTPYCLTIDTQTLEDDTITVRERDSMEQTRVATSRAREYLFDQLTK